MNEDLDLAEPTLTRAIESPAGEPGESATVLMDDDSTRVVPSLFCPICGGRFPGGLANCTTDGSPLLPVGLGEDLSGTVLREKYVLVQKIGQGGFAQVYRATHRMARAEVAVKVIRDELRENPKARRQFLKEARASMRIQSRYAVAVHDVDEDEAGRMYVVMELLRGQNLEEHMKLVAPESRRLPWNETARIVIEICDALEEAHDHGIVHRDLKPANVMMVEGRQGRLQAKVVDFGIASLVQAGDSDLTSMDNVPKVIGTPSFMSPEQARGLSVTHKSDLYSLGAMMYRMVTGSRPFDAKTDQGMLIAHVMEQPESIRSKCPELDVPAAFDDLVMRMMAKKPEDRPSDASDVADALRALLGRDVVTGGRVAAAGSRGVPVGMIVAIVGSVVVLALAGAAAAWLMMNHGFLPSSALDTSDGAAPVNRSAEVPPAAGQGQETGAGAFQQNPDRFSGTAVSNAVEVSSGSSPAGSAAPGPAVGAQSSAKSTAVPGTSSPVKNPAPAVPAEPVQQPARPASSAGAPSAAAAVPPSPPGPEPAAAGASGTAPASVATPKPAAGIKSAPIEDEDMKILGAAGPAPSKTKKTLVKDDEDDRPEDESPEVKKTMDGAGSAFDQLNF